MSKLMSADSAGKILLVLLGTILIIHILVLIDITPPFIDWVELIGIPYYILPDYIPVAEIGALFLTLFSTIVISVKMKSIKMGKYQKAINVGVWAVFIYMTLNSVGNLASLILFGFELLFDITYFLISLFSAFLVLKLTKKESLPFDDDMARRRNSINLRNLLQAGVASTLWTTSILFIFILINSTGIDPITFIVLPCMIGIFPGYFIGIIDGVVISVVPLPFRYRVAINCAVLGTLCGILGLIFGASILVSFIFVLCGAVDGFLIGKIIWRGDIDTKT